MDHDGGVVVPMGPDGFDKLDESAAGLWDAVFGPRCVVEVTNQNVVPVLRKKQTHREQSDVTQICERLSMNLFLNTTSAKGACV